MKRHLHLSLVTFLIGGAVVYVAHHSVRTEHTVLNEQNARLKQLVDQLEVQLKGRQTSELNALDGSRTSVSLAPRQAMSLDREGSMSVAASVREPGATQRERRAQPPFTERTKERGATNAGVLSASSQMSEDDERQRVAEVQDRLEDYLRRTADTGFRDRRRQGRALLEELRAIGEPAIMALLQSLDESVSSRERSVAASMLGGMGDPQALAVLESLVVSDPDVMVRRGAMRGLRLMGASAPVEFLEQVSADPAEDRIVRFQAAYGLAKRDQVSGVVGLVSLLESNDGSGVGRHLAFRVLRRLDDPAALPAMRRLAGGGATSDISYRIGALEFVGRHGDENDAALLRTVSSAEQGEPALREAAQSAYQTLLTR